MYSYPSILVVGNDILLIRRARDPMAMIPMKPTAMRSSAALGPILGSCI